MTTKKQQTQAEKKCDPTLPFTEIEILGKTYKMCLDFESIARAESELGDLIGDASLLQCSWNLTMLNARTLFAVSLRVYHPEIAFAEARRLVTWSNSADICLAIRKAQNLFLPEVEATAKADPPAAPES